MPFWRRVVRSPASSRSHCPITRSATAGLARLDVVRTMHERKDRMAGLSDAFVMLPGGFGTLEQFMEAVTWRQLAIHVPNLGQVREEHTYWVGRRQREPFGPSRF